MRGTTKFLTMLVLAAAMAVMPSIGSQGAGALDGRQMNADMQIAAGIENADRSLNAVDRLAEREVLSLTRF